MKTHPRAIVFDFDGVILESHDIKTEAFRTLFADYPEHVDNIVAHHVAHAGISRHVKFRHAYEQILGLPFDEHISRSLSERFSSIVHAKIRACPFVLGARRFIERRARDAMLFIASGTPEEELREIVEARGLASYFTGVYGSPQSKTEILAHVLAERRLPPSAVVFIGDAMADHDAALAAGVRFVARLHDSSPMFPPETVAFHVRDFAQLDAAWPPDVVVHPSNTTQSSPGSLHGAL